MMHRRRAVFWRMPWEQCSFYYGERKGLKLQKIVKSFPNVALNTNDTLSPLEILRIIGKCASDVTLANKTDWPGLYSVIKESLKTSKKAPTQNDKNSADQWDHRSLVKLIQNAAYIANIKKSQSTDFLKAPLQTATNYIAKNISKTSDGDLIRIIFACAKGSFLNGDLIKPSFFTLIESEVVQRLKKFQAIHLLKALHSVVCINASAKGYPLEPLFTNDNDSNTPLGHEFTRCLISQLLKVIEHIGSIDIGNAINYIAYAGFLNEKFSDTLNKAFRKRLLGLKTVESILPAALSLAMYGVISAKTAESTVKSLERLAGDISYGNVFKDAAPAPEGEDGSMNVDCRELGAKNKILFPLKLFQLYIYHNNPQVYAQLSGEAKTFLNHVRRLQPMVCIDYDALQTSEAKMEHLQRVLQGKLDQWENYTFVPHIHEAYILDLCDPVRKVVLQPSSSPWEESGEWSRFFWHTYYSNRNRHLQLAGYQVHSATHE